MSNGAKDAMTQIWAIYLRNLARTAGGKSGRVILVENQRPPSSNPFLPGLPGSGVAGPPVPVGYYSNLSQD